MGLDVYIEARIKETATGRFISESDNPEYEEDEDKYFFQICSWNSRIFSDIREKMIAICNHFAGTHYTDSDDVIPVPPSVLREIYACIVNRSYLSDNEDFAVSPCNQDKEWYIRNSYEKTNLINAGKLHDLLWNLHLTKYENRICMDFIDKKYIPNEDDRKSLEENPRAYSWEFRILNSY